MPSPLTRILSGIAGPANIAAGYVPIIDVPTPDEATALYVIEVRFTGLALAHSLSLRGGFADGNFNASPQSNGGTTLGVRVSVLRSVGDAAAALSVSDLAGVSTAASWRYDVYRVDGSTGAALAYADLTIAQLGALSVYQWGVLLLDADAEMGPIEPAFRHLLLASDDVTAIVADRVYIGDAPQDERRARIILTTIDDDDEHTVAEHAGYVRGRMQVNCLAPESKAARSLARAAKAALDSESGTIAGCEVDWIKSAGSRTIPTTPLAGKAAPAHGIAADFMFMHHA